MAISDPLLRLLDRVKTLEGLGVPAEDIDTIIDAVVARVTKTTLGLNNVDNTSDASKVAAGPISEALGGKQAADATLSAIAALVLANNKLIVGTGAETAGLLDLVNAGTFTPTFALATPGTLAVTYSSRAGRYLKLGNWVVAIWNMTYSPTYGTGAGNVRIGGLPFAASADQIGGFGEMTYHTSNLTYPSGYSKVGLNIDPNNQFATLRAIGSGQNGTDITIANLTAVAGTVLAGWMIYRTV